ncbi:metabolite traffic protein EboE [Chromobacterium sp. IIBBL 290-4]|uniref:metabolite traffic protein EboE n=1 Tax=Chromobacterium sp. IIBBL 290-4 TaxID=2953890 RepID=UPI0020B6F7C1|nr:metabolite traffic protein EboE [Chromobacterium sp. IIBBL 290-4]UTH74059.1 metabolite traffic protein EboE [Chromobacterium sp. IIBBL 290-4]
MKLSPPESVDLGHLCYCANIHPGESWDETRAALGRFLPLVKARISPDAPFGVGLRLSALAAQQLEQQAPLLAEFQQFLARHQFYVFTINGFPYGRFHGAKVKEQVYQPDWRHPARLEYSNRLARLLTALLPKDQPELNGSISTVPGAFAAHLADAGGLDLIIGQLLAHIAELHRLHMESGRQIQLALEPEPGCLLETCDDAIRLFQQRLLSPDTLAELARLCSCPANHAETLLRRHLGLCLDCCHAAVEFEDIETSLNRLRQAGIAIAKLQLSAGLRLPSLHKRHEPALQAFAEDAYLHQVVQQANGQLTRFNDLPEAMARLDAAYGAEWRIHFHVPLWAERFGELESTRDQVERLLALHRAHPVSRHLEVETYSWGVLPETYRSMPLEDNLARELAWVKEKLQ